MKAILRNRYNLLGIFALLIAISFSACKNSKVEELKRQASQLSNEGKHLEARSLYSEALKMEPDNLSCLRDRAWEDAELKDFKSELIDENKILEIDPSLTSVYISRAYCELKFNDTNKAISDYKQVLKIDSSKGDAYFGLGDIALHRKDTAGAIGFFMECERHDTTNCSGYGEIGWIEMQRKLYREAEVDVRKAIDVAIAVHSKTELEVGYRTLGLIKRHVHDTIGTLKAFTNAIETGNAVPIDYYYKAIAELDLKDTAIALNDCLEGCKCSELGDTKDWRPYYLKSNIEYDKHQYTLSFIDAEKEIKVAPDNKNGYYRRGLAHIKLGNKDLGCEDFYRAKQLGSKWADSVINIYCK